MEQFACKIHSQQVLYIEALANVDMTSHRECGCRWCNVDGGRRWWETWKHVGTFSDAIARPKVNLRAAGPEGNSWMGRKPECNALGCAMCGLGGTDGIPICSKLETSEQTVVWKMFEDVIIVPASADGKIKAKKLANQTVQKEGELCTPSCTWLITLSPSGKGTATGVAWRRFRTATLMVAIVHFNPQTHVGGGRVHVTETWIFASEDMAHDCDFHLHGLARMADHYLRGDGSEATAAAREKGRTPRIHMLTDGCGKQYKGRRNSRFLADSVRQIGFFINHHFAATSHFKGCHDGIGGVAKNAMKRRESEGEESTRKYFAKWSPYRMRRVHVEFIGKKEIYRPNSILEGVEGTREMYHCAGANTPKRDGSTSTKGREDDCMLVLKSEGQGPLSSLEKSRLRKVKVLGALASRWKAQGAGLQDPISREEDVTCRKVKRTYSLRTRLASCFCSACLRSEYEQCYVSKTYPRLVPAMKDDVVKEPVIMDTGVAPVDENASEGINFPRYKKECKKKRITGTQWQEGDSATASKIWEELGRKKAQYFCPFRKVGWHLSDILLVFARGAVLGLRARLRSNLGVCMGGGFREDV
ncbi:unnamed protein product [Ectocarpus sp. CCAP 1310/34]|nr:unnamed protein product [Ectocarpus sp. CCAP 1310/34]